jgi:hypothetical protein
MWLKGRRRLDNESEGQNMAGRPRTRLRRVLGLLERLESLSKELDGLTPAMYRDRERGAGESLILDGWRWCHESMTNAQADLQLLATLLREKIAAPSAGEPAGGDARSETTNEVADVDEGG